MIEDRIGAMTGTAQPIDWEIEEEMLPQNWAGHVFIEADEEAGIAAAYPVTDMPLMDSRLFTFACPDGDTRLITLQRTDVVVFALLSLGRIAARRKLTALRIETCCGDDLTIALAFGGLSKIS